jgi:predicted component of type VI protein secretion system
VKRKFDFDPNYVQWYEGMPLMCHHFQQADIRSQNVLSYILSNAAPYAWGAFKVEIDLPSVLKSVIRLTQIECIMPDYSVVFFPIYNDETIEIDVSGNQNDEEFFIYCCLPSGNYVNDSSLLKNRYKSVQSDSVNDMNTETNEQTILRLAPAIYLSCNRSSVCVPILKCVLKGKELRILKFDPPCPNIELCKNAKELIDTTLSEVYDKIKQSNSKLKAKSQPDDFEQYGHALSLATWQLQNALKSKNPNPFVVYQHLISMCVTIANVIKESVPPIESYYDHLNILTSFQVLTNFVREKIGLINKFYSEDLGKFDFDKKQLKVVMHFDLEKNFQQWINQCILCSSRMVDRVKNERVIGCIRNIVDIQKVKSNTQPVVVNIEIDDTYCIDTLLLIKNDVHIEDAPGEIYLLEN